MKINQTFAYTTRVVFFFCSITFLVLLGLTTAHSTQNKSLASKQGVSLNSVPKATSQGVAAAAGVAKIPVMVELRDAPGSAAYAQALQAARAQLNAQISRSIAGAKTSSAAQSTLKQLTSKPIQLSPAAIQQVKNTVQRIDATQRQLLPSLTGVNIQGQMLYRMQKAYNGIAMYVDPSKISAITALPNVKAVHRMVTKYPSSFSDIDFTNTRAYWNPPMPAPSPNGLGLHGENIKVADIDTGLDYIHVNFGGPGSTGYSIVTDHSSPSSVPNAYFPSPKVPGGYDFAGDAYDGTNSPSPDPDPFDGEGHGTGTASLIGGYGVTAGGFIYPGPYDSSTPIGPMLISPGYAPNCKLYPLRVFGSTGGTNLVGEAIEWAMDPNGDGSFADHMDLINMSLGAPDGFGDDPDQVAASNAAAIGIIVVSSAGNDNDSYYDVSGPSVATGTLSVAATYNDQNGYVFTAIVNEVATTARQGLSEWTTTSPTNQSVPTTAVCYAVNAPGPTGDPHDGSHPLTNAAECNGKIVVANRVPGQGSNLSVNAQNAGAVGIIDISNSGDPFLLTTSPSLTKPMVVCPTSFGNSLVADAAFDANGHSTTGATANMARGNGAAVKPTNPPGTLAGAGSPDTVPSYTSRGPRSGDSALKPDIAAPAEVTGVALAFTGNEVTNFNGTSSSCPHVVGAMALMRQQHPTWSVAELNALACNTATHDIFTRSPGPSPSPTPSTQLGVGRVGAGRIDVGKASQASVIAFNQADNAPSISFGDVEVPIDGSVTLSKNVLVENKGVNNVTYNLTYQGVTSVPGANFSTPASITVNAGNSGNIPVTFAATGNLLRNNKDRSVSFFDPNFGIERSWLSEHGGYLVLTPTSGPEPVIRVALYAAPKPVSSLHATGTGFVPTANTGSFNINFSGSGINSGPNYGFGTNGSTAAFDIVSLVKPFELQYANPLVGAINAPTDPNVIKYVGVTSDYATVHTNFPGFEDFTTISFGIDGFGDWTSPVFYDVGDRRIIIDADQDTIDDFIIQLISIGVGVNGFAQQATDNLYIPIVFDLNNPDNSNFSNYWTDELDPLQADVNIFNNSAVVVSVDSSQINILQGGSTAMNYRIENYDRNLNLVSATPELTYDVAGPGLEGEDSSGAPSSMGFQGLAAGNSDNASPPFFNPPIAGPFFEPFMYVDSAAGSIPINYNGVNFQTNGSLGVLLIHMHNGAGNRSDVVLFRKPTISGFSPSSGSRSAGTFVTINGANFNSATKVKFGSTTATTVNVLTSNTLSARVPAAAPLGSVPIRVSNAAGTSTSAATFTVTP